jgi:hypothetical protein
VLRSILGVLRDRNDREAFGTALLIVTLHSYRRSGRLIEAELPSEQTRMRRPGSCLRAGWSTRGSGPETPGMDDRREHGWRAGARLLAYGVAVVDADRRRTLAGRHRLSCPLGAAPRI